jgi:hypothetical protein
MPFDWNEQSAAELILIQPVTVTLVEKRQGITSPMKTRITLFLDASGTNNAMTDPGTRSVNAKKLIEALQASPASVEG